MNQPKGFENIYHNNHNIYILGAGFSVDAGMPIVSNFMKIMRTAASAMNDPAKQADFEAINDVLRWRLLSGSAAHRCKLDPNNIEELFSLIDGDIGANGRSMGKKETMQKAIVSTLSYCAENNPKRNLQTSLNLLMDGITIDMDKDYLSSKSIPIPNPANGSSYKTWILPIYDAIASILSGKTRPSLHSPSQRNTIITFNYDTVVEDAFERIGARFNLGLPDVPNLLVESDYNRYTSEQGDNVTNIFKLHGSINWKLEHSDPCKLVINRSVDGLWSQSSALNYILEPPTWNKGRSADILQNLWDASLSSIRKATRIFIIGYSLPETDMHFKYLMASGLAQNISLESICFVNPVVKDTAEFDAFSARVFRIFREELKIDGTIEFLSYTASSFILAENTSRYLNKDLLPFRLYPDLEHSFFSKPM